MNIIRYPERNTWSEMLTRPVFTTEQLDSVVKPVLNKVKSEGDSALKQYTEQFDQVSLNSLIVTPAEFEEATSLIDDKLKSSIDLAFKNIRTFHAAQQYEEKPVETLPGVVCWRKSIAIQKVGLYIPGGSAPLFSTVLMLGIPARIAGCEEVVLCTPPGKDGKIHPAILYSAQLLDIKKVFKVGGAQAIAGLAYGTESIPKVDKIFGPGNQFVTVAKQMVNREGTAIDMPAGPSEVAVLADSTGVPAFIAADLLSQAEHGNDSQVLLICNDENTLTEVEKEVQAQLDVLPRKEIASRALENSKLVLVKDIEEGIDLVNEYAAEHLILQVKEPDLIAGKIKNAGSVFLGNYTPEAAGDYASGTNHTLPTNGFARAYSGVSLDSYVKKVTFQKISQEGLLNIGPAIENMAETEELEAHKRAVSVRLKAINQ